VSFPLKFKLKRAGILDYRVMPLEGLWWSKNDRFDLKRRDKWHWTAMIMQPEQVTQTLVVETVQEVLKKKDLPAASELHLGILHEGVYAQVMHIGPYSEDGYTIEMLHEFIENKGYHRSGKHHEIYLGNPRRTAPEKLRTVLRQPIR